MAVDIFNRIHNPQLDHFMRERLQMLIGRFPHRVGHIDVNLFDENAGKGGEDKLCTIDVKLIPRGRLHVRAEHSDMYAAALKAIHRAEQVVAKTVDRGHSENADCRSGMVVDATMGGKLAADGGWSPAALCSAR